MTALRTHLRLGAIGLVAALALGCSAGPAASPSPASVAPSASAISLPAGFPLGTWTSTINEADLELAGLTGGEVGENSGVFTLTLLADGTWSMAQDTDAPIRWPVFRGTFIPTGPNRMEQVTTFPPDYAGDVVSFDWALDDGNLLLEVVDPPDPILPIVIESHPWAPAG